MRLPEPQAKPPPLYGPGIRGWRHEGVQAFSARLERPRRPVAVRRPYCGCALDSRVSRLSATSLRHRRGYPSRQVQRPAHSIKARPGNRPASKRALWSSHRSSLRQRATWSYRCSCAYGPCHEGRHNNPIAGRSRASQLTQRGHLVIMSRRAPSTR